MNIINATENHLQSLKAFIQPYEFSCAGLAAIIRKNNEPVFIISNSQEISSPQQICGVFSYKHSIYHCLPDLTLLDNSFELAFVEFFKDKKVSSIIGRRTGTEYIYSLLQKAGHITEKQVFYKMMTLDSKPNLPPQPLVNDDEIRRCMMDNIEDLHNLQKEYMETEIAPVGRHITDLETDASLKQIFKNQLCFALYSNETAVAKVNTNAIGFNWIQIGGVFTHPMYRHNYYAWHLISLLCHRIQKSGRHPCLFVKERNSGAFDLYSRIGFVQKDNFAIFYLKVN